MVQFKIISVAKQSHGADLNIRQKARELRKKMTPAEKTLWNYLSSRKLCGMHFRRQHPFGIYILDFYCNKANLAIEVDGDIHKERTEYDKRKVGLFNIFQT